MVYLNCIVPFSPFIVHPLEKRNIGLRLTVDDAKSFQCGNVWRRLRCIWLTMGHSSRRRPFITVMVLMLTHTHAHKYICQHDYFCFSFAARYLLNAYPHTILPTDTCNMCIYSIHTRNWTSINIFTLSWIKWDEEKTQSIANHISMIIEQRPLKFAIMKPCNTMCWFLYLSLFRYRIEIHLSFVYPMQRRTLGLFMALKYRLLFTICISFKYIAALENCA